MIDGQKQERPIKTWANIVEKFLSALMDQRYMDDGKRMASITVNDDFLKELGEFYSFS